MAVVVACAAMLAGCFSGNSRCNDTQLSLYPLGSYCECITNLSLFLP